MKAARRGYRVAEGVSAVVLKPKVDIHWKCGRDTEVKCLRSGLQID